MTRWTAAGRQLRQASSWLAVAGALCALPAVAQGAEATSTPAMLRGDLWLGYHGGVEIVEAQDRRDASSEWLEVGRFTRHRQGARLSGAFSLYHGIALQLGIPIVVLDRLEWSSANELRYDPDVERPTGIDGSPLSPEVLEAAPSSRIHRGIDDLSLGFRFVPFAERGLPGRGAPASLAFDIEVLIPNGGNHDRVRNDDTAGPGQGGVGLRLGMAGSRRLQGTEPWIAISWTHRAPYRVDLRSAQPVPGPSDAEGTTELDPADEFSLRFGADILALEDSEADTGLRIGLSFGVRYVGPDEISSGTLLPAPLEQTVGHVATTGDHLVVDGGLGIRVRPRSQVEVRVDFGGGWIGPHVLEQVNSHAYSVRTGPASFFLRWSAGALIRFR